MFDVLFVLTIVLVPVGEVMPRSTGRGLCVSLTLVTPTVGNQRTERYPEAFVFFCFSEFALTRGPNSSEYHYMSSSSYAKTFSTFQRTKQTLWRVMKREQIKAGNLLFDLAFASASVRIVSMHIYLSIQYTCHWMAPLGGGCDTPNRRRMYV